MNLKTVLASLTLELPCPHSHCPHDGPQLSVCTGLGAPQRQPAAPEPETEPSTLLLPTWQRSLERPTASRKSARRKTQRDLFTQGTARNAALWGVRGGGSAGLSSPTWQRQERTSREVSSTPGPTAKRPSGAPRQARPCQVTSLASLGVLTAGAEPAAKWQCPAQPGPQMEQCRGRGRCAQRGGWHGAGR